MSASHRRLLPLLLLSLTLTGCASTAPTTAPDAASEAPVIDAGQSAGDDVAPAGGAGYGCTDGMLASLADKGFADVPPVDPGRFSFPEGIELSVTPTCFVSENDGQGASRESALFFDDPEGAIDQADAAFRAAGWQGGASDSLAGKLGLWWSDGADQMAARHSVGAGVVEVDGRSAAWFSWAV